MPKITENFSQEKVDIIRRQLERETKKGRPKDYEIIIDGFKVVPRTDDIDEFEDYEINMGDTAKTIDFLLFDGATNRNTRYSFRLNAEAGLSGVGQMNDLIQQKLDEQEKDHKLKALTEKVAQLEDDLSQSEQFGDELRKEVQALQEEKASNKFNLSGFNLVEFGGAVLKHTFDRNANKSGLVGQLSGIMGMLSSNGQSTEDGVAEEVKEEQPMPAAFSERQMQLLSVVAPYESLLDDQHFMLLGKLLVQFMQQPAQLVQVAKSLNVQI